MNNKNNTEPKKPNKIIEKIKNKLPELTKKDSSISPFLNAIYKTQIHKTEAYKKHILPIQLNISSQLYREERAKLIEQNKDNYETAKIEGDKRLKKLHPLFSDFDIPDNIKTTVNFYGKQIEYKIPISLASFEYDTNSTHDLGVIDVWANKSINRTLKTAMLDDRGGNDEPRIADLKSAYNTIKFPKYFIKLKDERGLINTMGLPGIAAHKMRKNLLNSQFWKDKDNRTTLSIGGETISEYIETFKTMYLENYYSPDVKNRDSNSLNITSKNAPYLDFIDFEINVSCPNTGTGTAACDRIDGEYKNFGNLLSGIKEVTGENTPPVYIKLSPDFDDEKILELVGIIQEYEMGVVLGNTQSAIKSELSTKTGGLSGPGLNKRMLELVKLVHNYKTDEKDYSNVPIKACGGISTAYDVLTALNAGADTVQMAYAVIEDPYNAIPITNLELSRFCKDNDYKSLDAFKTATEKERTNIINSYTFRQKT